MSKSFLLLFIIILLSSCKKTVTSVPVDNRRYYTNAYLTHFDNFKMYTKGGEIASRNLADKYAQEFGNFFFTSTSSFTDPDFQKFELINDDSIINLSRVPVIAVRNNMDVYDKYSSRFTAIVNDTNAIDLHIIKYKTITQTTSRGFTYFEIESPVYILKRTGDTLFFPIVRYIIISRGPYVTTFVSDKFNNVFSPAGVDKLGQYDTLVVQSFDLAMKKSL